MQFGLWIAVGNVVFFAGFMIWSCRGCVAMFYRKLFCKNSSDSSSNSSTAKFSKSPQSKNSSFSSPSSFKAEHVIEFKSEPYQDWKSRSRSSKMEDQPDGLIQFRNDKPKSSLFSSLFGRKSTGNASAKQSKRMKKSMLVHSKAQTAGSSYSKPNGDSIDFASGLRSGSCESFETTTTDSEFYRDWRHSIDFGTAPVLNSFTANNNQVAIQVAFEQTQPTYSTLGSSSQPQLTDENATELISTPSHSSRSKQIRNALFERFLRKPAFSSSRTEISESNGQLANGIDHSIANHYRIQNEINKQRSSLVGTTTRAVANRSGNLDTNMNVLYI